MIMRRSLSLYVVLLLAFAFATLHSAVAFRNDGERLLQALQEVEEADGTNTTVAEIAQSATILQEFEQVDTKAKVSGEFEGAKDEISVDSLSTCHGPIEPADYLTFEVGGPNFRVKSDESLRRSKAMQLKPNMKYRLNQIPDFYKYGKNFDYADLPFKNPSQAKTRMGGAGQHMANAVITASRVVADVGINMAKGISDAAINAGKGVADALMNAKTQVARGLTFSGAQISAAYASQRQTTSRTGDTIWTDSDIAVDTNKVSSTQEKRLHDMFQDSNPTWTGKVIRSRFKGNEAMNIGNISYSDVVEEYKKLARERAILWEPHLKTPAAMIDEWHKVVFGKCFNVKDAGDSDYFQAVTSKKVEDMWNYEPSRSENEEAFQ